MVDGVQAVLAAPGLAKQRQPTCTCWPVPTVDTTGLIAVVRTVVDFITLFGAVDAGAVTALELIGLTRQQSWGTPGRRKELGAHFRAADRI